MKVNSAANRARLPGSLKTTSEADCSVDLRLQAATSVRALEGSAAMVALSALALSACGSSADPATPPTLAVPAVPSGLVATSGTGQVVLAWSASANATGYSIGRSTVSAGPYPSIGTSASPSFTDSCCHQWHDLLLRGFRPPMPRARMPHPRQSPGRRRQRVCRRFRRRGSWRKPPSVAPTPRFWPCKINPTVSRAGDPAVRDAGQSSVNCPMSRGCRPIT